MNLKISISEAYTEKYYQGRRWGNIQGGINRKLTTRNWLFFSNSKVRSIKVKTRTRNSGWKIYQENLTLALFQIFNFCVCGKTTESCITINKSQCLLKAPAWSRSRKCVCFKWPLEFFLHKSALWFYVKFII